MSRAEAEKVGLNSRFRPGNTNKPFCRPSQAADKNHMARPAPFPRGSLSDYCLYLSDRTQSPLRVALVLNASVLGKGGQRPCGPTYASRPAPPKADSQYVDTQETRGSWQLEKGNIYGKQNSRLPERLLRERGNANSEGEWVDSHFSAPREASGTPTFSTRVSGESQLMCRRQAWVTSQCPHPTAPAKGLL